LYYLARAKALFELSMHHLNRIPTSIFEVGAGFGYNLLAFTDNFPRATVATDEPDQKLAGSDNIKRDILRPGAYDVVLMSHVLEHFTNPIEMLERGLESLTPGGVLVIEVPNDVPGVIPLNVDDEPHLLFLTEPTLKQILPGHVIETFAAGPPYRLQSGQSARRASVKSLVKSTPGLRQALEFYRQKRGKTLDFAARHPRGMFLRAVVKF
jgi:SAM-dependent methyltransferase